MKYLFTHLVCAFEIYLTYEDHANKHVYRNDITML